jgi:hypothetical protein
MCDSWLCRVCLLSPGSVVWLLEWSIWACKQGLSQHDQQERFWISVANKIEMCAKDGVIQTGSCHQACSGTSEVATVGCHVGVSARQQGMMPALSNHGGAR